MTDEEFEKEVQDLAALLRNLRLIRDKGQRKWLVREIRALLIKLTKDQKSDPFLSPLSFRGEGVYNLKYYDRIRV